MAAAYTDADAIGLYLSASESATAITSPDASLGGVRLHDEIEALGWHVDGKVIPGLIVQQACGTTGIGTIRATGANVLAYTAPGDAEGAPVAIASGESVVLPSNTSTMWVRVLRIDSTAFVVEPDAAGMTLEFVKVSRNPLSHGNVTNAQRVAGLSTYRAAFLGNHSANQITSVTVRLKALGTARTSDSAQLGASGSGTITTTGSLVDWPDAGWVRIVTSGGTLREVAYYTSRTGTTLTIPTAGRGLLGTTAAAGAATDTITPIPGIRVAIETPDSDMTVQVPANENTAPTGMTWYTGTTAGTGASVGALESWQWVCLRTHREIPAGASAAWQAEAPIIVEWVSNGVTYSQTYIGVYSVESTALAGDCVYVGVDANPDWTTPTAFYASRPWSHALAAPVAGTREYRVGIVPRNAYGLLAKTRYLRSYTIDSLGALVRPTITAPSNVTATVAPGGYVTVSAQYRTNDDSDPANMFVVYAKAGSDPVPGVDAAVATVPMNPHANTSAAGARGSFGIGVKLLRQNIGPYSWASDMRVLVRALRSSDNTASTNTTATAVTVTTAAPNIVTLRRSTSGAAEFEQITPIDTTSVYHVGSNTRIRQIEGESQLWCGTSLLWRCSWPDASRAVLHIPTAYSLQNDGTYPTFGAGTGAIEYVAGPPVYVYLNAGGARRVRFDLTNSTLRAESFATHQTLTDCPDDGPIVALAAETLFQVFDPTAGRWVAYASVTSAGVLKIACALRKRKG